MSRHIRKDEDRQLWQRQDQYFCSHLFLHLLGNEVVFGEIPPEGLEAARVVEGGAADEAGHSGHAVDAEEARDEVDAR